ncbi:MAG: Propeptide PepSY amd peptidase [Rhodospirillales bacterium]|nr:Propeptide PepSY amd peptidase [Rhodospirillales bacterium]
MSTHKLVSALLLGATLVGAAGSASAYTGEELATQAKVGVADARAIALKAFPGTIADEELEKEKGGTGLRFSFDIQHGKTTHEVGVDANTGKVLENKREGKHPD